MELIKYRQLNTEHILQDGANFVGYCTTLTAGGELLPPVSIAATSEGRTALEVRTRPAYHGVESAVWVRGVVDGAPGTVGFRQAVLAPHHVAMPRLVLVLEVARCGVVDVVGVGVLGEGVVGLDPG